MEENRLSALAMLSIESEFSRVTIQGVPKKMTPFVI